MEYVIGFLGIAIPAGIAGAVVSLVVDYLRSRQEKAQSGSTAMMSENGDDGDSKSTV